MELRGTFLKLNGWEGGLGGRSGGRGGVYFFLPLPPQSSSLFPELVGRQPAHRIKWATLAGADGINNTGAAVRSRANRGLKGGGGGGGFPGTLSAPQRRDGVKMN